MLSLLIFESGFAECLLHSKHSHERSTRGRFLSDAQHLLHLLIAQLYLAYRKFVVRSLQILQCLNARLHILYCLQRLSLVVPDGREDACTCNHDRFYHAVLVYFVLFLLTNSAIELIDLKISLPAEGSLILMP